MKFSLIYEAQTADELAGGRPPGLRRDRRAGAARRGGRLRRHLGGRAHRAHAVRAHERARDLPRLPRRARPSGIHVGHGVICLPPQMNHPVKVAERSRRSTSCRAAACTSGSARAAPSRRPARSATSLDDLPPDDRRGDVPRPRLWSRTSSSTTASSSTFPAGPSTPSRCRTRTRRSTWRAPTTTRWSTPARAASARSSSASAGPSRSPRRTASTARRSEPRPRRSRWVSAPPSTSPRCARRSCSTTARRPAASASGASGSSWSRSRTGAASREKPDPTLPVRSGATTRRRRDGTSGIVLRRSARPSEIDRRLLRPEHRPMLNPNHAYGTVEDCIGYVDAARRRGRRRDPLPLPDGHGARSGAQLETIRNIGEHVIPHFQGR